MMVGGWRWPAGGNRRRAVELGRGGALLGIWHTKRARNDRFLNTLGLSRIMHVELFKNKNALNMSLSDFGLF